MTETCCGTHIGFVASLVWQFSTLLQTLHTWNRAEEPWLTRMELDRSKGPNVQWEVPLSLSDQSAIGMLYAWLGDFPETERASSPLDKLFQSGCCTIAQGLHILNTVIFLLFIFY